MTGHFPMVFRRSSLLVAAALCGAPLAQAATSELLISEYGEGSGFNKYIEIYNGTGAPVDLESYEVWRISNGGNWPEATISLSGILGDGEILVVHNPGSASNPVNTTIAGAGDQQLATGTLSHNGDDAIGLAKGGNLIDAVGEDGADPGSGWDVAGVSNATADQVLVRKETVCGPTTDWTASRGTSPADSEWIVLANEDWRDIGIHSNTCGGAGGAALTEPFDDASQFTTSTPFFSDGFGDFFGISDGFGGGDFGGFAAPNGVKAYTGLTGSFLTGMDLNGEGAALPILVDWTAIDISGLSSIEFRGDFAEFFDVPGDIDASDYIQVEYQIDGGGFVPLISFRLDVDEPDDFNGVFREDLDFDGRGEGAVLGDAAQTFIKPIAGSGTSLDLRLSLLVEAGDEDFAVDNFIIQQAGPAGPQCIDPIAIADVQGPGDVTPLAGQEVVIRGLVTADFGSEILIQDDSGNPRSGMVVFASGNSASVGDEVCVTGIASERFEQTQVGGNGNPDAQVEILGSGKDLPAPVVLTTAEIASGGAAAEQWEAMLVRVENVTVANADLGFGEFSVDDGSGPARVDDKGAFTYIPQAGQALEFVQGPLNYTFGNFKIEPRDDEDISVAPQVCGDPVTLISAIQGTGAASPLVDSPVAIEGIVVGDFQDGAGSNGDLNGFFVQEEDSDADGNPQTSEGIFVFDGSNPAVDVQVGDKVRVSGLVTEFFDMTQIDTLSVLLVCDTGQPLPAPTAVTLPLAEADSLEAVEGMYVTFPQDLTISEYFNFDRFGEILLSSGRLFQPTGVFDPETPESAALAASNALDQVLLDDGLTVQNPDPAIHPNGAEFTLDNRFRGGDRVQGVTGVINYAFSAYRIQPTRGATYTAVNPRSEAPDDTGGSLKVASFNVLNYFNTLDNGTDDICGASQNQECRGADNLDEQVRQLAKISAALIAMDADIIGLIELENTPGVEAAADIVAAMNLELGDGAYDYIDTGVIGTDAIKVGLLYRTATVNPAGAYAVLDSQAFVNPFNADTDRNRPALAQTFVEIADGADVTVVVNHLKSKGSGCGPDDDSIEQGSCNLTRTAAAQELASWLATDPTGSGDTDILIIGDLNSYDREDPIITLTDAGYTDLAAVFLGELAYGYLFGGQLGYLDYALASEALLPQVTGVTHWHINADEPDILDYDTSFKQDAQDALYEPNAYRSSDHDPVIVGIDLNRPPVCENVQASVDEIWPPNHQLVDVEVLGVTDPDSDPVSLVIDRIFQDEPLNAAGDGDTYIDGFGVGTGTAQVRAERSGKGNGRVYYIGFTATDTAGNSCSGEIETSVPRNRGKKGQAIGDGPLFDSTGTP